MIHTKLLLAGAITASLSGCVTNPLTSNDSDLSTMGPETQVPSWYLNFPEDDDVIYASGTGISDDLQFSMKKATHSAKVSLGDKIASDVGAQFKSYTADNSSGGQGRTTSESESVSKSGFKDVSIRGYDIIEKAAFKDSTGFYRTYVLVSLSLDGPQFTEGDYNKPQVIEINT